MAALVDTTLLIDLGNCERDDPSLLLPAWLVWLCNVHQRVALSQVSVAEFLGGARDAASFTRLQALVSNFEQIDVTGAVAQAAAESRMTWRQRGQTFNILDRILAATVRLHDFDTLVTRNVKDFPDVVVWEHPGADQRSAAGNPPNEDDCLSALRIHPPQPL